MSNFGAKKQNQPSREGWVSTEKQVDFWGFGPSMETSGQLLETKRSSLILDIDHTRRDSLENDWFGPVRSRGHSTRCSIDKNTRSSREQRASPLDNEVTSYWLKENERTMIFGSDQPRRLFPAAGLAEPGMDDDPGWGRSPTENTNAYDDDSNDVIREQLTREFWEERDGHWYTLKQMPSPSRAKSIEYDSSSVSRRPGTGTQQGYDADRDDSEDDSVDDGDHGFYNTTRTATQQSHHYHRQQQQQLKQEHVRSMVRPNTVQTSSWTPPSEYHDHRRNSWQEEDEWKKPWRGVKSRDSGGGDGGSDSVKRLSVGTGLSLWEPESDSLYRDQEVEVVSEDLLDFGTAKIEVKLPTSRALSTANLLELSSVARHLHSKPSVLLDLDDGGEVSAFAVQSKEPSIFESLQGLNFRQEELVQGTCAVLHVEVSDQDHVMESMRGLTFQGRRSDEILTAPGADPIGRDLIVESLQGLSSQEESRKEYLLADTNGVKSSRAPIQAKETTALIDLDDTLERSTMPKDESYNLSVSATNSEQLPKPLSKPMPPRATPPTSRSFEFANSTDWINQLEKKEEQRPSRENREVTLTVETRCHGLQPIHITERANLREAVQDFCTKFDMLGYDKALFVKLATMLKNQKSSASQVAA